MAHVAEWKKKEVEMLTSDITKNSVIGLVDFSGIPAPQMQQMRANTRDKFTTKVIKNRLFKFALKNVSDDIEDISKLEDIVEGKNAVVLANENPFKLFRRLESTKTPSPAKGGESAPEDISLSKGPTPFKPGPIVGDLQRVGIPAAIEKGKVMIKKNVKVVSKGETISPELALMLTKLDIFPIIVGLNVRGIFSDNMVFTASDLAIDIDQYRQDFLKAAQQTFNLSVNASIFNKTSILPIMQKAHRDAYHLAINGVIPTPSIMDVLLGRAHGQMTALASHLDEEALDDDLKNSLSAAASAQVSSAGAGVSGTGDSSGDEGDADEDEEDEEEEEEASEEDAAAGLGALFG